MAVDPADLVAAAAAYGVDVNASDAVTIDDDALLAFARWAHVNRWDLVATPGMARRVLHAYAEATP